MDFDEQGRLFVVEMPGYPLDTKPTGRVKLLEDTDGDGRFDTSRVFADGLTLPTGVMRWKKGVLVTAAPDLLYLEDTNGDGRADVRTVVITGFAVTNPQHMVNGPVYGLDNWIYLAHEGPATAVIYKDVFGDRGTALRWPDHPHRPTLTTDRRGVRLRPDAGLLERTGGASQFGHGFDAWGRYFTTENADHARHEVMPAAWLARNPDLLLDSAMAQVPDHGAAAQVFPISRRPNFELLTGAGEFTSACAITPIHGRRVPGSGRDLALRRRARAQPRAPRRADARGRHVRREARRAATRVPRCRGRLVPSGVSLHRPGRRPVRRRLLPSAHRASGMDVERSAEGPVADVRRPRARAHLQGGPRRRAGVASGRAEPGGRRRLPTWCAHSTARTCGGGARRSACSWTGSRVRRSRQRRRWRRQPHRRSHASTRCGRSTASARSTTRRSSRRCATRPQGCVRTPCAWRSRASAPRRRWPAASSPWPTSPMRASGSSCSARSVR